MNVKQFYEKKEAVLVEYSKCLSTSKVGTILKVNKDKTMLFIQKNQREIDVIIHKIGPEGVTQTGILLFTTVGQRTAIHSFTPFDKDKLFVTTIDGQVLIYFLNKFTKTFKLLGKNKIYAKQISVAEICPLGNYVVIATSNQYAKLDKLFCWRLNSSYQLVLPLRVDLSKNKLSKDQNSYFSDLKIGYIAEQPLFILTQHSGQGAQLTYTCNAERLIEISTHMGRVSGLFHRSIFANGHLWMIDSSGKLSRINYDL